MKSTPQPKQIHSWLFSLLMSLILVMVEAFAAPPPAIFSYHGRLATR